MKKQFIVMSVLLAAASFAHSADTATKSNNVVSEMLKGYQQQGASDFSAQRGEAAWKQQVKADDGSMRSCGSCHGDDLSKAGQHRKTQKPIEPMAASANPERYTDPKHVEKWFKRNCTWTWGRECTAQEKGDILSYLNQL